jgi:hypothetical protein
MHIEAPLTQCTTVPQVQAELTPETSSRVAVQFKVFRILGLIPVNAPPSARGKLDTTYLDDNLRVHALPSDARASPLPENAMAKRKCGTLTRLCALLLRRYRGATKGTCLCWRGLHPYNDDGPCCYA